MVAPASEKLRTVLDYVPCEACLAQPVDDQELLCSICRRVDRQVGVRIAVKTTVILERPSAPAAPVVIPPPAPAAAEAPPPAVPVEIRYREPGAREKRERRAGAAIEVFIEPMEEPPAEFAMTPPAPEVEWEDVATFTPEGSDIVGVTPPAEPARVVTEAPTAEPEPEPLEVPRDDYVFRPPAEEEAPVAAREPEPAEEWMPQEEVPVEPLLEERSPWAPPLEEEKVVEMAVVEEEDDVVETMVEPDAPPGGGDLWRLRGFDADAERRLQEVGIREVAHLAGHDASELAARTSVDAHLLAAWVQVADLKEDVGVPLDAALALVAAGIAGPKGLRETEAEDVVEKVQAFGAAAVNVRDVKRWKRRA